MTQNKKIVAWGPGTLLKNYLGAHPKDHGISYVVDSFQKETSEYMGLPLYPLEKLKKDDLTKTLPVIFSVNSLSRRAIGLTLNSMGLRYGDGYLDCADLFRPEFEKKLSAFIGEPVSGKNYSRARSHYNNSHISVQTTICGNWLLLECLQQTAKLNGSVAEIGSYRGGNSVLMLQAMAAAKDNRPYFIMDSYEGFPEFSPQDPIAHHQREYTEEYNFLEIQDRFAMFDNVEIIRGFVPQTFPRLPQDAKYSLIFFDCDLHDPAVATLDYFWDKMLPGGYIILHDYVHALFGGVTVAVDEWARKKNLKPTVFFENTIAAFKKQ